MNRLAYLLTDGMISFVGGLSKLRVRVHGTGNIRPGPKIFLPNSFSAIEALLLPYHIYLATQAHPWTLADASFCQGALPALLELSGAGLKPGPDLDRFVVKTLLAGEADWLIFPPLLKSVPPRRFNLGRLWPPHIRSSQSIAAFLALRAEFFRGRVQSILASQPEQAQRLKQLFELAELSPLLERTTWLTPVNVTCYPARVRQKLLATLSELSLKRVTPRLREEMLAQGRVIFSDLDIDVRFGEPFDVAARLRSSSILSEMTQGGSIALQDRLRSFPEMRKEALRLGREALTSSCSLTTVNHDHLFATLLSMRRSGIIAEERLRRRVYLFASLLPQSAPPEIHGSLELDQSHLLTDDRFHKYGNFLSAALGQGVTHQGTALAHDKRKCSLLYHTLLGNALDGRVRAADPLATHRRKLLLCAWLPDFMLRRMVAAFLERLALREFEEDYAEFHRQGVSKEPQVGAPVLLKGRSRRLGVVLVHGFMSAPREVAELAGYLNAKGFWVYQVRLKGHGTSPDDLARTRRAQWVECVDRGYALLNSICEKVVVGGFSFGGGIALDCASRIRGVGGVFAVCPPHRLADLSSRFEPAVTAWNRVMDVLRNRWAKLEFVETAPERPQINYARLPVAALRELAIFMRELEPKLSTVTVPVLVLQSENDPVVDPRGTWRLFELLGSGDKQYRKFPMKRHGILAGPGSEEVHAAIGDFVERVLGEPGR
jgi:esterase/lipase